MKTKNQQYRQGDVLLQCVASLPKGAKKVPLENGRVILAHGKVTGHSHYFDGSDAALFAAGDGQRFVRVKGRLIKGDMPITKREGNQVLVEHPTLGLLKFAAAADVTAVRDTARINGRFGLWVHDSAPKDHHTHAVPAGVHSVRRQSEFSRQLIRQVQD